MKQLRLFTNQEFLRVEIIKSLGETFNGRALEVGCPECGGRGWAFVVPLIDPRTGWCPCGWICESCQTQTGSWEE
jgi:hypothetical protein